MKQCPMCNNEISDSSLICSECSLKIHENEQPRRESVLYAWGRGLMIFLALMFFLRGMYALLEPEGYQKAGEAIGLRPLSQTAHYLNASLLLLTGILYAISWIGGYLDKIHRKLCFITLLIFITGQLLVQFWGVCTFEEATRSFALILFWITLPLVQYITFSMGKPHKPLKDTA